MKRWISLLVLILLSGCAGLPLVQPATPTPAATKTPTLRPTNPPPPTITPLPTSPADALAFEQNRRLGRGVNLGNALEAPVEGEWGMVLEESYFDLIVEGGFDSVRVPVRWDAHALTRPPYTIEPAFFERVDWVVNTALQRDLAVVINIHHFDPAIMEAPQDHKDRFLEIWAQIAERYQDYPDGLYFELMNEPYGTLGTTSAWNQMAAEAISIIRKTNPYRTLIVGPGEYNGIYALYNLQLPEDDRNLIVTVHYYLPFQFTHQGADWVEGSEAWLGKTWRATSVEKDALTSDLDLVYRWGSQKRRPIYLGEFGAYSMADMESRRIWTDFVAREAEKRGFSWAYWEFGAGFGVYDREAAAWNEPILKALMP